MKRYSKKIVSSLVVLSLLVIPSTCFAQAGSVDLRDKAEEFIENYNYECILTNEETGAFTDIDVIPVGELTEVNFNRSAGESQYYQDAVVNIGQETLLQTKNARSSGYVETEGMDQTYSAAIRIRLYFSVSQFGGASMIKADQIHLDYQVSDQSCWFTHAEGGYRIAGINEQGYAVDESESWLIPQAQWSCDVERYATKNIWVRENSPNYSLEGIFYGRLYHQSGSSWTCLIKTSR